MNGNDHARRCLIAALLLTLAADALFPRQGPAAEIISASFWAYAVAVTAFAARQLALRARHGSAVPVLKWVLLAVCVVSLFAATFLGRTASALVVLVVSFPALVALVVLAIRDAVRGSRARRVAT